MTNITTSQPSVRARGRCPRCGQQGGAALLFGESGLAFFFCSSNRVGASRERVLENLLPASRGASCVHTSTEKHLIMPLTTVVDSRPTARTSIITYIHRDVRTAIQSIHTSTSRNKYMPSISAIVAQRTWSKRTSTARRTLGVSTVFRLGRSDVATARNVCLPERRSLTNRFSAALGVGVRRRLAGGVDGTAGCCWWWNERCLLL